MEALFHLRLFCEHERCCNMAFVIPWTLYQPQALVWDYSFWGGREAFGHYCGIQAGKCPSLQWENFVPPLSWMRGKPFLKCFSEVVVLHELWRSFRHCYPCSSAAPFDYLSGFCRRWSAATKWAGQSLENDWPRWCWPTSWLFDSRHVWKLLPSFSGFCC